VDDHVTKLLDLAHGGDAEAGGTALDAKTASLVLVGALIASGAAPAAYVDRVHDARAAGASVAEVVDTLVAVSATVGAARVVSASRGLSYALGYDIDAAIEGPGRP
jgi:alkylhydroperoxidase/carboxymuconolactone decarboxylase family protein YurZ